MKQTFVITLYTSFQVSWVEHVEVDEKIQTHHLFKDLVNRNIAYGAERWLLELQRMCERFTSLEVEYIPNYDIGGGYSFPSLFQIYLHYLFIEFVLTCDHK